MSTNDNTTGMSDRMKPFVLRVTARDIRRRSVLLKVFGIICLAATLVLGTFYALSAFVNKAGNFTVFVPDGGSRLITLSNTSDFQTFSTMLEADSIPEMDNITKSWMPATLDQIDGAHNGENYIAHTFYLKNVGEEEISYSTQIDIHSVTKETDNAIRVMVIKNGVETVYAKAQKGSTEPEPDTVAFLSNTQVMTDVTENFTPEDVDKFTVVIWLEGEDPECVDDIKGGVVKMSMNFKILEND